MSASLVTNKWLKYFANAGLPSNVSANYAVIFTENRIQPDMLLDLNKEYLYDMGIKVMGDVIAILRYARTAYTQEAQAKILGEPPSTNRTVQPPALATLTNTSVKAAKIKGTSLRSSTLKPTGQLKRSFQEEEDETPSISQRVQRKKVIRLGTTQKSNEAANKEKNIKHSVFRRLGAETSASSSVSSSTDAAANKSAIFDRLGPLGVQSISSKEINKKATTELRVATSTVSDKPLPYKGVFKPTASNIRSPISFSAPSKSPEPTKVTFNRLAPVNRKAIAPKMDAMDNSVRSRLGNKPTSSSAISTTTSVQARLALKKKGVEIGQHSLQRTMINPKATVNKTPRTAQRVTLQSLDDLMTKQRLKPPPISLSTRLGTSVQSSRLKTLETYVVPPNRKVLPLRVTKTGSKAVLRKPLLGNILPISNRIVRQPKAVANIFDRLGPL